MKLRGLTVTCNYPDEETEANLPQNMTVEELAKALDGLLCDDKDITSFVVTAAIDRAGVK